MLGHKTKTSISVAVTIVIAVLLMPAQGKQRGCWSTKRAGACGYTLVRTTVGYLVYSKVRYGYWGIVVAGTDLSKKASTSIRAST